MPPEKAAMLERARELVDQSNALGEQGRGSENTPLREEAWQLTRQALGPDHPTTLKRQQEYAVAVWVNESAEISLPLWSEIHERRSAMLGERARETLTDLHYLAIIQSKAGRLDEAGATFQQVIALREEALGEADTDTIVSLSHYGGFLAENGRPEDALAIHEMTWRRLRSSEGANHPDTIAQLSNYAAQMSALERFKEAVPLFAELLRAREATLGERDPVTIASLNLYAVALDNALLTEEAQPYYERTLALSQEVHGRLHPNTMNALGAYVVYLVNAEKFDAGLDMARDYRDRHVEAFGKRDLQAINAASAYANFLIAADRWNEGVREFDEVIRLRREVQGDTDPQTIAEMNQYAVLLSVTGRGNDATRIYADLYRIKREVRGADSLDTLNALTAYASNLDIMGQTIESEPLFDRALAGYRQLGEDGRSGTFTVLTRYALILMRLGRLDEASIYAAEAVRLAREWNGDTSEDLVTALLNHAKVARSKGQVDEAMNLAGQALNVRKEMNNTDFTSPLLADIAALLLDAGAIEQVDELLTRFKPSIDEDIRREQPIAVSFLANRAQLHEIKGEYGAAGEAYGASLDLSVKLFGAEHPFSIQALKDAGRFNLDRGDAKEALGAVRELTSLMRERYSQLSGGDVRTQTQRDRELGERREFEGLFADALWANREDETLAGKAQAEAFMALQIASSSTSARAVVEAASTRFASQIGVEDIAKERQALAREWLAIEAALVEARGRNGARAVEARRVLRERLEVIETRMAEIDERLAAEAPQFFAILSQQAVDPEELRAVLGEEEAVLFLVPTERGTHAMAVTRTRIEWIRSDWDEARIASAIGELRAGLEISGDDAFLPLFDLGTAHALYAQLVAPLEKSLRGISRVYVIADGPLSRLPLGTLVTQPPAGDAFTDDAETLRSAPWLADRYALVQLPSLQSLVYIRSFGAGNAPAGEAVFRGFGAPVLKGAARLRGARSATLDPVEAARLVAGVRGASGMALMNPDALRQLAALPGTRAELEQVREALGAPREALFLGDSMTESAIRSADLSTTRVLHLATHGFTSEESGEAAEPGLVFTPPADARPEDDGYLAASEVVGLDLALARWVILSACNTASPSGRPGETGLSGLAQAFFYAGAQSLLVSHWPVFDDIAPLLTVEALKRSEAGEPRAEALQGAMQAIRADPSLDAAHPAVWAPFTLVGEGR